MTRSVLDQAKRILRSFSQQDDGVVWCVGTTVYNEKISLHLSGSISNPEIWEAFGYGVPSTPRLKKIRIDGRMMQ